ncbi:MAG TPA: histidine kinase [Vitreimonas sp.]|uniref:sensor histidine kinase n=1 Tax=Vitreimonas sp. TaxID=3069702 RepID=UPI002D36D6D0|nr:histidine kinase [Vitreimonas sp.]HYD86068.1 histidine kinase [Vitreimonas sp.]
MVLRQVETGTAVGGAKGLLDHPGWTRWGAHVAFWLMYFAFRTAAAAADPPHDPSDFPYLLNRVMVVASYAVLTGALLAVVAGPRASRSNWARNLALVLGALALAPLTQYSEQVWPLWLAKFTPDPYPFIIYLFQFGWALPLWGLTQALLGYHFETMAQARAVSRAQALAYDAQLKMLHYQINPHFLFNTLNAISTLVLEKRNAQAESMILKLAGFLRYSLDRQPTEMAALTAEMEAQRKYLEIEQTRFDDKLKVKFSIEPGLENARLPSLILQPILENAIKYAITPRVEGGSIDVSATRDGDLLRITIEDDGPGLPPDGDPRRRRGVGLANARERLELIYGGRAGLTARNREPQGCRVEIWLPVEEERVGRTPAPALS